METHVESATSRLDGEATGPSVLPLGSLTSPQRRSGGSPASQLRALFLIWRWRAPLATCYAVGRADPRGELAGAQQLRGVLDEPDQRRVSTRHTVALI